MRYPYPTGLERKLERGRENFFYLREEKESERVSEIETEWVVWVL